MAILLTGLTGNLGSCLAARLREYEKIFYLVRNGKERARSGQLCGVSAGNILNSDITKDNCQLSKEDIRLLRKKKIKKVIHIAASVKFDEHLREETWKTNYSGTLNLINLAKEIHAEELHYVSTAYADTRRNPYEESKAAVEEAVKNSGIPYSIYAPSIIIGDSKTGYTYGYDGFYGYFGAMHRIVKRERRKREKMGLSPNDKNGKVRLPIKIYCARNCTLNLIPVDWVVQILLMLMEKGALGEKYYLTHPNPPEARWMLTCCFRYVGLKAFKFQDDPLINLDCGKASMRAIQKAVNSGFKRYEPYVTEEKIFSLDSTIKALGDKYFNPRPINRDFLEMLLDYAIVNNFGKE